ncbi:MAG: hypothetical protein QXV73_05390 [Candidatus Micrarchaeia archaeon]
MENQIVFIKGIDVTSMVKTVNTLTKKMQAKILGNLESYFDDITFVDIRKHILDSTNDFARDIVRTLIGDVEV